MTFFTPLAMAAFERVLRAEDVGAHRLHRIELAGGHLLQRGGVEHVVHAAHRVVDAVRDRARRRCRTSASDCAARCRMSSCFFSSRLKMRISGCRCLRKRPTTALPNEPVPPVISSVLSLNISHQRSVIVRSINLPAPFPKVPCISSGFERKIRIQIGVDVHRGHIISRLAQEI